MAVSALFRDKQNNPSPITWYSSGAVGASLGVGSYGQVRKYLYNVDEAGKETFVAVKRGILREGDKVIEPKPGVDRSIFQEGTILSQLKHPNIITLIDVGVTKSEIFLVLPLAETSLEGWMRNQRKYGVIDINETARIIYQCLRGLEYLHANNVVHADVKPGNVLIFGRDDSWPCGFKRVVLSDMGVSIHYDCFDLKSLTLRNIGTQTYKAPELHLGGPVSPASDIWALGIMMGSILYRDFKPSPEPNTLKDVFQLFGVPTQENWPSVATLPGWKSPKVQDIIRELNGRKREWIPKNTPTDTLLQAMLQLDPTQRPSASSLLAYPFLEKAAESLKPCNRYSSHTLNCKSLLIQPPNIPTKDIMPDVARIPFYKRLLTTGKNEMNDRTTALAGEFGERSLNKVLGTKYKVNDLYDFALICLQLASWLRNKNKIKTENLGIAVPTKRLARYAALQLRTVARLGIIGDISTTYDFLEERLKTFPVEIHQDAFDMLRLSYATSCGVNANYYPVADAMIFISLAKHHGTFPKQHIFNKQETKQVLKIFINNVGKVVNDDDYTLVVDVNNNRPQDVLYALPGFAKHLPIDKRELQLQEIENAEYAEELQDEIMAEAGVEEIPEEEVSEEVPSNDEESGPYRSGSTNEYSKASVFSL
jgi:serine/threonine protein kinase